MIFSNNMHIRMPNDHGNPRPGAGSLTCLPEPPRHGPSSAPRPAFRPVSRPCGEPAPQGPRNEKRRQDFSCRQFVVGVTVPGSRKAAAVRSSPPGSGVCFLFDNRQKSPITGCKRQREQVYYIGWRLFRESCLTGMEA